MAEEVELYPADVIETRVEAFGGVWSGLDVEAMRAVCTEPIIPMIAKVVMPCESGDDCPESWHEVQLLMLIPMSSAAAAMAIIRDTADREGHGTTLTAMTDQAAADVRDYYRGRT